MHTFKSWVRSSVITFFLQTGFLLILIYSVLYFFTDFRLTQITLFAIVIFLLSYFLICYLYAGFFNNDIIVFNDRIEILNRIPLFKKHFTYKFENITSVKFRHEWTETFGNNIKPGLLKYIVKLIAEFLFPANYKWIKIRTDKEYKFYCFGIQMDYYENENEPVFEEIFTLLSDKGVSVSWTNNSDKHYQSMNASVKNKIVD